MTQAPVQAVEDTAQAQAPVEAHAPLTPVEAVPPVPVPAEPSWTEHDEPVAEREETPAEAPAERRAMPLPLAETAMEGPEEVPSVDLVELGRGATDDLLKAMGFDAKITARAEGDRVDVTVEVADRDDLLTGPKGEVRQSMQHLLNRMINRGEGSRYHLQLEINDFWAQREEELRRMAADLASEALEKNDEVVTEFLNAQERRIIHVALREDERVKTYSLGTGMIKRLAIAPADFAESERDDG